MKYNRKGFTLVELLSVIAILGIIASAIIPRVGNYSKSAKKAMFLSDAKTILSAVELYNVENDEDEAIKDQDNLDTVKIKLVPQNADNKKYLNNWPIEFPNGVNTIEKLKEFVDNPNLNEYYK